MDYCQADLETIDAELTAVERRRAWMADTVTALKARNVSADVAARQEAQFASMLIAMRNLRAGMEQSIIAERARSPSGRAAPE